MNQIPPPDDVAHQDGRLMHDATVVNGELGRYVLRFLNADAGRDDPLSTDDERSLADRVAELADVIRSRADRREQDDDPPPATGGSVNVERG